MPEWQFIAAKSRICLSIYWNLGIIPDEDEVIEKYISLDDVGESVFYDDFVDLKKMAEDNMAWTMDHKGSPFDRSASTFSFRPDPCGDLKYRVHEMVVPKRKEFIQFYWREADDTWDMMSVSREPLSDLMRYFKDFDELDRNELHLRRFLSEKEYAEEGSE